jgi:heptaprenyl diphosphate synthase
VAALTQPIKGTRKLTRLALLTAIALTIFLVEAQIPAVFAIPGIKLGLANIVTVWILFTYGAGDAALVLCARIFLGAVFAGNLFTILYSAGGGFLAWCVLCLLSRVLNRGQMWLASPVSGVFHNIGQLLVAAGVMKTTVVFAYLPWLLLSGICAGLFTGLCAQFLANRLDQTGTVS